MFYKLSVCTFVENAKTASISISGYFLKLINLLDDIKRRSCNKLSNIFLHKRHETCIVPDAVFEKKVNGNAKFIDPTKLQYICKIRLATIVSFGQEIITGISLI